MKVLLASSWVLLIAGCSFVNEIDSPPVGPEDVWIRNGSSRNEIRRNLKECGFDSNSWDILQQEKVDLCMLDRKFVFIETPYKHKGHICHIDRYKALPSCQSLLK